MSGNGALIPPPPWRAALRWSVTRAARLLVRIGFDSPALAATAAVLRRAPTLRVARSLGWHLGQAASGEPRVAHLRSGSRMSVDVRDYAHRHAFLFGVYEEDVTRLLASISRRGWTVLDVGANAGYISLLACDLGGPRSRVVAFEPNPRMVELLRRSAALNPGAPVEIIQAACGAREGQVSLSVSSDPHNTGLSTVQGGLLGANQVAVEMLRLDRFCASRGLRPDLLKIDVEGAEAGVLFGAEALLRQGLPAFVVCELWAASREDVVPYMAAMGYTMHGILPDGSLAAASASDARWQNVCFRHRRAGSAASAR